MEEGSRCAAGQGDGLLLGGIKSKELPVIKVADLHPVLLSGGAAADGHGFVRMGGAGLPFPVVGGVFGAEAGIGETQPQGDAVHGDGVVLQIGGSISKPGEQLRGIVQLIVPGLEEGIQLGTFKCPGADRPILIPVDHQPVIFPAGKETLLGIIGGGDDHADVFGVIDGKHGLIPVQGGCHSGLSGGEKLT